VIFQRPAPAELVSPRTRERCVERLRETVGSSWLPFSPAYVVGSVRDDAITLRRTIWYRNSFQTILRGQLRDDPQGTRLSCRFGLNRFVFVFMCIWFAGVIGIGGTIFFGSLIALAQDRNWGEMPAWLGILFPLLMGSFGAGLFAFCRYLARNERDEMLDFLREELSAWDADALPPGPVHEG
jgi:hypothetical protein